MIIISFIKNIYKLFPAKFKNKSLLFVVLLILGAALETFGIGIIFPVIDFLINGEFSRNFLGFDLEKIFLYFNSKITIKNLIFFIVY